MSITIKYTGKNLTIDIVKDELLDTFKQRLSTLTLLPVENMKLGMVYQLLELLINNVIYDD